MVQINLNFEYLSDEGISGVFVATLEKALQTTTGICPAGTTYQVRVRNGVGSINLPASQPYGVYYRGNFVTPMSGVIWSERFLVPESTVALDLQQLLPLTPTGSNTPISPSIQSIIDSLLADANFQSLIADQAGGVSQSELNAAIAGHIAATNPHAQYATDSDLSSLSANIATAIIDAISNHTSAIDPHPGYALDSDLLALNSSLQSSIASALATHAAATDPHSQYATDADLSTLSSSFQAQVDSKQGSNARLIAISSQANPATVKNIQLNTDGTIGFADPATGGGGSSSWGGITGTLSSQTDLQNALNAKQVADADLTAIAGLTPTTGNLLIFGAAAWTNRNLVDTDIPSLPASKITTGILSDAIIPASIARDTEVSSAVTAHEATRNHPDATTSLPGLMSATDKTKLDGIATGATANNTNAFLLDRANHTGTQTIATISNFNTGVDNRIAAQKGAANGLATLGSDLKISTAQLPDAVLGALSYQGTWNAATNSPTIPAGSSTNKGYYYVVTNSVSVGHGYANVPNRALNAGDWLVSNGIATTWDYVDSSDQVSSVNGYIGAVALTSSDIGAQPSNSNLTTIAGLTTSSGDFLIRGASAWTSRAITDSDIPSTIARDTEVTSAITTHESSRNHPNATSSLAGLMSSTDKSKLDGVSSGATANSTDAFLLSRANHTGSQATSTITGLDTALSGKQSSSPLLDNIVGLFSAASNGQAIRKNTAGTALEYFTITGTNLSVANQTATTFDLASSTGTSATIPAATTSLAGLFTSTEKTKLNGIATGATANSSDATLLSRTNHTGTQSASTISDFSEAVDDRVASLLLPGANISLSYDDNANTLTVSASAQSVTSITDSKTLALTDLSAIQYFNHTSAITLTIPNNASVAFPVGSRISLLNNSVEKLTIVAASGVTLDNKTITPLIFISKGNFYYLTKVGTDSWILSSENIPPQSTYQWFSDCAGLQEVSTLASGTGAAAGVDVSTDRFGVMNLDTGTTATGRVAARAYNSGGILLGSSTISRVYFLVTSQVPTLTDGTETFSVRHGLLDSATSEATDAVMFRHSSANSGNWECVCRSGGTETTIATSLNPTNWHTLEFLIDKDASSVEFFGNGTSLGTITTNIPKGPTVARHTGFIPAFIIKSAGTTSRTSNTDRFLYLVGRN